MARIGNTTFLADAGQNVLNFPEGGAIRRLEVDELTSFLGDLDEPWPTAWKPEHEAD